MKSPRLFFLLCLPAALCAATSPPVKTSAPDRYAILRQRIDALFKIRTDPPPFPVDSPNPFHLSTDVAPGTADTPKPLAHARVDLGRPLTDAELLPRLAAGLRLGGVIELGDTKPRVLINQRTYREGDIISIVYDKQSLKLLVKALDTERLTLALNDAELAIRLKKSR